MYASWGEKEAENSFWHRLSPATLCTRTRPLTTPSSRPSQTTLAWPRAKHGRASWKIFKVRNAVEIAISQAHILCYTAQNKRSGETGEVYKLIYAARHGEGHHNVAEAKVGSLALF